MENTFNILHPDIQAVQQIQTALKCHPVIAAILANRGINSPAAAASFMKPSVHNLRSPSGLKDMDVAVHRIYQAIRREEKILIFGDYDVDGITATCILLEFLQKAGADISHYIPHRIQEGYGLQTSHIREVAAANGIQLIITADCGSSSHEAVETAKKYHIDIVITDHHQMPAAGPQALAIVNPNRHDCSSGLENLAGVGVAFYLLMALRKHMRDMNFWDRTPEPNLKNLCDLVALGTVADQVPLLGENRILTRTGLDLIDSGNRPGIRALKEVCNIRQATANTEDVAYKLAPRLNAAGRMAHANISLELLATRDADTARRLARSIDDFNAQRQMLEKKTYVEILEHLNDTPDILLRKALVLSSDKWNVGVLGIVASRLVEKFFRPVVLIALEGPEGKGSARSLPGFDLYQGLLACSDDLETFGGHCLAAGLKIKAERMDRFRVHFETAVSGMSKTQDLTPALSVDAALDFRAISAGLVDELQALEPFGPGNSEPLFTAGDIHVLSWKIVGKNHRKMLLKQGPGSPHSAMNAIHFNIDPREPVPKHFEQIAFRLRWNEWNGNKIPQIIIDRVI